MAIRALKPAVIVILTRISTLSTTPDIGVQAHKMGTHVDYFFIMIYLSLIFT